jgi:drug/metabolite transporter (DMT)-like permease
MSIHPISLALLSAVLFGAATPASKALLTDVSPLQLAGLLYLGAALGVAPTAGFCQVWRLPWRIDRRNRWRLSGAVLAGGVLGPVVLLAGLQKAPAASVSLWLNLELVATASLGHWLFRDHLTRTGWLGVGTALGAAFLLSIGTGQAGMLAGFLVLLACCCWGLDNHLTALIDGLTPSQSTFWKGLVAGSVNTALGLALQPVAATWSVVAGAVVVGMWSYGASIALYIQAAQRLGATRGQVFFATAPFFGLLLSAVVLGEGIQVQHYIAGVLFVGAIVLLWLESHVHQHKHTLLTHAHRHRHDDRHHTHRHPGLDRSTEHTHWHEHEPIVHAHPHWPDLHHRHTHDFSEQSAE